MRVRPSVWGPFSRLPLELRGLFRGLRGVFEGLGVDARVLWGPTKGLAGVFSAYLLVPDGGLKDGLRVLLGLLWAISRVCNHFGP